MTFWEEFGETLMNIVKDIINAILKIFGIATDEDADATAAA